MPRFSTLVSARFKEDELKSLDTKARAVGMSRSGYLRACARLPLQLDLGDLDPGNSPKGGTVPEGSDVGVEDFPDSFSVGPEETFEGTSHADPYGHTEPSVYVTRAVALTDKPIRDLRIALDRWGTNYNQATHALNILAMRFDAETRFDDETRRSLLNLMSLSVENSRRAAKGIREIRNDLDKIISRPVVDLREGDDEGAWRSVHEGRETGDDTQGGTNGDLACI